MLVSRLTMKTVGQQEDGSGGLRERSLLRVDTMFRQDARRGKVSANPENLFDEAGLST